ncbi:RNA polymerase sigma factor [Patulibacter sp. NPDC049589]|uniref:RNA polymerase sigma factor n=1 Tax=Patulibacter sp. NPDC049589 TaxID=3154731 RepID=UPI003426B142
MRGWATLTDEELLAEVRPGRAGPAFAELYARHERTILAYFARRVRGADVAADLMAETFVEALASRERFRPQGAHSAVTWLFGIARHTLLRSVRRGRVEDRARRRLGLVRPALDDEHLAAIDELLGGPGLLAALESLPADQRDAVRAHVLEEDEYAVIAARLSCSEAVVRKRVSRGLARLRRHTEETR